MANRRRRLLKRLLESYAVPVLLALVALRQIALTQTRSLSPWKGGGFGMFASLDRAKTRLLRCDRFIASTRMPVVLSRSDRVSRPASQVRSMPTSDRLNVLASAIAGETLPVERGAAPYRIHVEIRKLRFRSPDQRLFAELLADVDRPSR